MTDAPPAAAALRPARPERIGKYRIDGTIGVGAMGVVYHGFDTAIRREVAIKTIRPELLAEADGPAWRTRFAREVQAAARCLHPNVVTIYDFGESGEAPYIVMELCRGRPLQDYLRHLGRFDPHVALYVIGQVLAALGAAHAVGIVHRDIKPGNILLLDDGTVKVTDFGIARLEASGMTAHGSMVGTPSYMSPEQFAGGAVDARADVFAAGVLLYEMLAGRRPFEGGTSAEIMFRVMEASPPDLAAQAPGVGPALAAAVARALAREPARRYPGARAFAEALARAIDGGAAGGDATVIAPAGGRAAGGAAGGAAGPAADPPSLNRLLRERLPQGSRMFGSLPGIAALPPGPVTGPVTGPDTGLGPAGGAATGPGSLAPPAPARRGSRGLWIGLALAVLVALALGPAPLRARLAALLAPELPEVAPYQISVVSGTDAVRLEGHAPSPETAEAMRSAIALELAIEGRRLEGGLAPARGAPNANWPRFAPRMVAAIRPLSNPALLVVDGHAVVSGLARDAAALERVRTEAAIIAAEEGYALDFRVEPGPQPAPPTAASAPARSP